MSTWSGLAAAYRASFATLCGGTVERLLADTSGPDHLDVGSGTGALAGRAASLHRTVVAVDADPDMVAMSAAAFPGVVVEAALPDLPFADDSFDAVTANFVMNHVPDPRAAMRDLGRVTRPGGHVAATVWPPLGAGWAPLVAGAFDAAGVVPMAGDRLDPRLDFERSVGGLTELAESAGLDVVAATELTWNWEVSVEALWRGIAGGVGTVGQTFVAQSPAVRRAGERAFREAAAEQSVDGMLVLPSTAAYVVAS